MPTTRRSPPPASSPDALTRGDIVGTERVDGDAPCPGEWAGVLRHERIDVLSYPYEWPFEMLRDAARLQLALTRQRARRRRDHQGRLVVQRAVRRRQAGVHRRRLVRAVACAASRGRATASSASCSSTRCSSRRCSTCRSSRCCAVSSTASRHSRPPTLLRQGRARLHEGRLHPRQAARPRRAQVRRRRPRARRQGRAEAGRVRPRADRRPAGQPREGDRRTSSGGRQRSTWSELRRSRALRPTATSRPRRHSSAAAVAGRRTRDRARPRRQRRPLLAPRRRQPAPASVVAVDSDDLVVDRLYRELRREGEQRILPLVIDLADPSPGLGWRTRERAAVRRAGTARPRACAWPSSTTSR